MKLDGVHFSPSWGSISFKSEDLTTEVSMDNVRSTIVCGRILVSDKTWHALGSEGGQQYILTFLSILPHPKVLNSSNRGSTKQKNTKYVGVLLYISSEQNINRIKLSS